MPTGAATGTALTVLASLITAEASCLLQLLMLCEVVGRIELLLLLSRMFKNQQGKS